MGAALWLCTGAVMAQLQSPAPSALRISGFGTVGAARIDAPTGWAYKRDSSQPDNSSTSRTDLDTRLGVQLNYAPLQQLELVGQAVATRRSAAARDDEVIELAFAAWRPNADWTLRGGRVNFDAFLLSDHRNVGFAYPFARPPVDFYAQLPASIDGGDVTRVWNDGPAQWRAKLFGGQTHVFSQPPERLPLSPLLGAMVSRDSGGLLLRASVLRTRFTTNATFVQPLLDGLGPLTQLPLPDVAAQAADLQSRLTLKDEKLTYLALGARLERGDWLASSEFTRVSGQRTVDFSAGYASVGRRFGALTTFTTASRVKSSEPTLVAPNWGAAVAPVLGPLAALQTQALADAATQAVNSVRLDQDTWALGARWDVNARVALKLQWDWIRVRANGSSLWGGATTLEPARANVGSFQVDFVF